MTVTNTVFNNTHWPNPDNGVGILVSTSIWPCPKECQTTFTVENNTIINTNMMI
jgi:hypothetical protein